MATDNCIKCDEWKIIVGKGLCRRCYMQQPKYRATQNIKNKKYYQKNKERARQYARDRYKSNKTTIDKESV